MNLHGKIQFSRMDKKVDAGQPIFWKWFSVWNRTYLPIEMCGMRDYSLSETIRSFEPSKKENYFTPRFSFEATGILKLALSFSSTEWAWQTYGILCTLCGYAVRYCNTYDSHVNEIFIGVTRFSGFICFHFSIKRLDSDGLRAMNLDKCSIWVAHKLR